MPLCNRRRGGRPGGRRVRAVDAVALLVQTHDPLTLGNPWAPRGHAPETPQRPLDAAATHIHVGVAPIFFMRGRTTKMDCPVCLNALENTISIRLPCAPDGHCMCLKCFIHMQSRTCPLCRASFEHLVPSVTARIKEQLLHMIQYEIQTDE